MGFSNTVADALAKRRRHSRLRQRRTLLSAQSTEVVMNGRAYLNFSANDYLGLASHPKVVESFQDAASQYGVGSGASHLVCGHSQAHHALEEELAAFTGRDRALLFSSGYMANLGVISAFLGRQDFLLEDKLNHASLLDAAKLSQASWKRFKHNDIGHAQTLIQQSNAEKKMIAVDGVFSMDGDTAPIGDLLALAQTHQAWLMVDDAHGLGVLGKMGAGTLEYCGVSQGEVPLLMGTLGKALGTAGAFVAGPKDVIEFLLQSARTYIYSTALPPAIAAATRTSLDILKTEPERRARLHSNIRYFRSAMSASPLTVLPSSTAIQPVLLGADLVVMAADQYLRDHGIAVGAIRSPTVPEGTARLRITLCSEHTTEQIDMLVDHLHKLGENLHV